MTNHMSHTLPMFLLLALLTACSTVTILAPDGTHVTRNREEFASYVEAVFRRQNLVIDDLVAAQDTSITAESALAVELAAAEAHIIRDCRYLNTLAVDAMEGRASSLSVELKLISTIARCELTAGAGRTLLDNVALSTLATSP